MSSEILEPPRDEYGNPILPGYRKPFQKGYDPRRFKGPYKSRKGLSVWDASRLLSKVESMVDELRKRKRGSRPHLQKLGDVEKPSSFSPTITPRAPKKSRSNGKLEAKNVDENPQQ